MSLQRLSSKGLFGALLPCEGTMTVQNEKVQCVRHIHPWECAILNGAKPDRPWLMNLKLGLCGLGQMASPFHSGWVFGQWMYQVNQTWNEPDVILPEQVVWALVGKAVSAREKMFPHLLYTKYGPRLSEFIDATHRLLFQSRSEQHTTEFAATVNFPQWNSFSATGPWWINTFPHHCWWWVWWCWRLGLSIPLVLHLSTICWGYRPWRSIAFVTHWYKSGFGTRWNFSNHSNFRRRRDPRV